MKIRNFLKRMQAVVLAFAMLAPIMGNLDNNVNEVQAEGTTASSEMLSIKCQVTNGVVTDTNIDKYRNNYVMRFVSSIDSLEYKEVGFTISYTASNGETVTKTNKTKTVFTRIESTTGSTSEGRDTYSFSPKVISTDSKYFITAKWPVAPADVAVDYTIRAFARTSEGTVYGPARCVSVEDGFTNKYRLNLSVNHQLDKTASYSVTYEDVAGNTVTIGPDSVKVIHAEDGFSSVRLLNAEKDLKSVTKISIKNGSGEVVATTLYRNLYTEYDKNNANTVDTSWYEEYLAEDSTETEFTIVTSADLYGFAYLANTGNASQVKQNFLGKKIYLVSDIAINDETLVTDSTDTLHYKEWYTYDDTGEKSYTATPVNSWTSIGKGKAFRGIFDGQMHTISGIYCSDTTQNTGLFAWAYNDSTIMNVKLTNSYFENSLTSKEVYIGSIAGRGDGKLDTIYSEAMVEGAQKYIGGLVGGAFETSKAIINNCWFDGRVTSNVTTSKYQGTGGFVGGSTTKTTTGCELTITNCLNTGIVDVSKYANGTTICPCAGGFVGWVTRESGSSTYTTVNISNCVDTGEILLNEAASAAIGYGPAVGYRSYGIVKITDVTYVMGDDYNSGSISALSANLTRFNRISSKETLLGNAATTTLTNFDFDTVWTTVPSHIPVLQSLKTTIIDDTWYDEDADTYVLYDKADLYGLAELSQRINFVGKTIKLGNDIDVNTGDVANWSATNAPQHEWIPIGSKSRPFAGTFDGGLHTISGIYLNTTSDNSGLFSATSGVSTIKNLELKNSYFTSTMNDLGSIAGQGRGLFDTVYSDATVVGSHTRIGGLLGMGYGSDVVMQYCWFDGTVTNNGNSTANRGTGGLMGVLYDDATAKIKNCLNTGTINAEAYTAPQSTTNSKVLPFAGGFVGWVKKNTTTLSITNSLSNGRVLVNEAATGMYGLFVGYEDKVSTSTNNYATTPVQWTEENEITEQNNPKKHTAITESQITGDTAKTTLTNFDFTNTWSADATTGMPVLTFSEANETNDTRWYYTDEYVLYDKGDLCGFSTLSETKNFANKTVKLGRNIVVNEGDAAKWATNAPNNKWSAIGKAGTCMFSGTFDGQGYSISGIYHQASVNRSGLFEITAASAVIKNFKLINSYFEATTNNTWGLGSIVGQGRGQFLNIYSNAIVTCPKQFTGGIIGMGYGTELVIKNCWYDGVVTNTGNDEGYRGTGGILGGIYSDSKTKGSAEITNCLNEGIVNVENYTYDKNSTNPNATSKIITPLAGGIVGDVQSNVTIDITNCLNVGKIQIDEEVTAGYGPIVGWNGGTALINDCYATQDSCADIGQSKVNANSIIQLKDADIKGSEAPTALPLLDWTNNWENRENDFPAIKFQGTASTKANQLQQKLASNVKLNATAGTSIEFPSPDGAIVKLSQGGCSYGGYYYQAFITYKDSITSQKDNQVKILKYNLTTGAVIWSDTLLLNHANDITYNTRLNCLVVCHNAGGANYVSYVDPDNLTLIDADPTTEEIDRVNIGFSIYSIDYNAKTNRYVVGVSGGQKFRILNSEFGAIYEYTVADDVKPEFNKDETDYIKYVTQGICSDDNYIYCVLSSPNVIAVYDWFGNYISYIDLDLDDDTMECESISVVDNTIYVAAYGSGLTDQKTYLYTIDVSALNVVTE